MENETKEKETERRSTSALTRLLAPREIKFRAWKVDGFLPLENLTGEGGSFWEDYMLGEDSINLCQYTGCKDKWGNEIYEGDIVSYEVDAIYEGKEDRIGFVKYKDDSFVIDNDSAINDAFLNRAGEVSLEVIGNIFENPELVT